MKHRFTTYAIAIVMALPALSCRSIYHDRSDDIRLAILRDFITDRSVGIKSSNLYCFFVEDYKARECKKLIACFRTNEVSIVCGTNRVLWINGGVTDRLTGSDGMIIHAQIESFHFPRASARVSVSNGSTGASSMEYELIFTNKQWRIIKKAPGRTFSEVIPPAEFWLRASYLIGGLLTLQLPVWSNSNGITTPAIDSSGMIYYSISNSVFAITPQGSVQ